MEIYEVRFLQEAMVDLEEIILLIAQHNTAAAFRMFDAIINKANDLSIYLKRGRLVPDNKMREAGYRMLSIKPYIVFYRLVEHNVLICRVLHGAMNYPTLY